MINDYVILLLQHARISSNFEDSVTADFTLQASRPILEELKINPVLLNLPAQPVNVPRSLRKGAPMITTRKPLPSETPPVLNTRLGLGTSWPSLKTPAWFSDPPALHHTASSVYESRRGSLGPSPPGQLRVDCYFKSKAVNLSAPPTDKFKPVSSTRHCFQTSRPTTFLMLPDAASMVSPVLSRLLPASMRGH